MGAKKRISIFSWGYFGWGSATSQLVKLVDAIEKKRGFAPPIFVDIRVSRSVRAPGFNGSAFAQLLGPKRYVWMRGLGNLRILAPKKVGIRIADPSCAETLLQLGVDASKKNQRLIFFCGCRWPREDGRIACHRTCVATLILKAARRRGQPIEIVEWPGSEPSHLEATISDTRLDSIAHRLLVPLPKAINPINALGPGWGTVITFRGPTRNFHRVLGSAIWTRAQWHSPVCWPDNGSSPSKRACKLKAATFRKSHGLNRRRS